MTDTHVGAHLWLVTARLAGGEVPAGAGGAYASIIVAEDGADAVIRERAHWVARTGDPAIATLHTFPRDN
jgi:hypothetical protein